MKRLLPLFVAMLVIALSVSVAGDVIRVKLDSPGTAFDGKTVRYGKTEQICYGDAHFDIGCFEASADYTSVADAKGLADGSHVGITNVITTAVLPDRFYVETPDRITGIGVMGVASVGKRVTVEGTLATLDGERVIIPTSVTENAAAQVPQPWFMNGNATGGGPYGLQKGVSDWRKVKKFDDLGKPYWIRELATYGGASNIGLLVKSMGRVAHAGAGFFYLEDGAAFDDGVESIKGIRIDWPFAAPAPPEGTIIQLLGISSCRIVHDDKYGDVVVRLLRPISPNSFVFEAVTEE